MTTLTVPALDTLDGQRLTDVTVTVRRTVRLGCGCDRHECDRPGGGAVHVLTRPAGTCPPRRRGGRLMPLIAERWDLCASCSQPVRVRTLRTTVPRTRDVSLAFCGHCDHRRCTACKTPVPDLHVRVRVTCRAQL